MKPRFYWAACAVLPAACSPEPAAEKTVSAASQAASTPVATLTVPTARGDAVVPKNPERVAVYDWAALDTLTEPGVNVGATTAPVRVDYLQPAFDKAATVGTLFEPDCESLHRHNLQFVITGGPGAEAYEQLAKNATTIDLTVDNGNIRTSGEKQMETLSRIFGKEARVAELNAQIDALFAQKREAAKGKGRGLVLSVTGNKVSAFGTQSRLASWIHGDIGLPPVDESLRNEGHGQPVSFEYIKEKNPGWIFIIDRTAAIGQEGPAAVEVLDNALVCGTNAWKHKQIIVMPAANYIVAGGARQLIQAAEQLKAAFEKAEPVAAQ
ncbi:siderophore ABC transporter substrate-binding protein [Neisseria gonorrhoeae]